MRQVIKYLLFALAFLLGLFGDELFAQDVRHKGCVVKVWSAGEITMDVTVHDNGDITLHNFYGVAGKAKFVGEELKHYEFSLVEDAPKRYQIWVRGVCVGRVYIP